MSCRSVVPVSSKLWSMLTPCIGSWVMPFTIDGSGIPVTSSTVGATSMT
jgi:hypothetical protein